MTSKSYNQQPISLGQFDFPDQEMMFWLYCPIKVKGTLQYILPDNLRQYDCVIKEVMRYFHPVLWANRYVYITVKTQYHEVGSIPNRPGWHSDGFMTDDINYVWSNNHPTEFACLEDQEVHPPMDHTESLDYFDYVCGDDYIVYPDKTLLMMDQHVIHRPPVIKESGMRTFIKVSVSEHKYEHIGNSVNHQLTDYINPCKNRDLSSRNCPVGDL